MNVNDIKKCIIEGNVNISIIIKIYLNEFINNLRSHFISFNSNQINYKELTQKVESSIAEMEPMKTDIVQTLKLIVKDNSICDTTFLVDFFESLLQFYQDNGMDLYASNDFKSMSFDNFRFFNHDLFISIVAVLIENERFDVIANLVKSRFIVTNRNQYAGFDSINFIRFRTFNYTLNEVKKREPGYPLNQTYTSTLLETYSTDMPFDKIVCADILLCYLSLLYPGDSFLDRFWYPETSIYNSKIYLFPKLVSKRYFEKYKVLFDVSTPEELISKIQSISNLSALQSIKGVPSIANGLLLNQLCTQP